MESKLLTRNDESTPVNSFSRFGSNFHLNKISLWMYSGQSVPFAIQMEIGWGGEEYCTDDMHIFAPLLTTAAVNPVTVYSGIRVCVHDFSFRECLIECFGTFHLPSSGVMAVTMALFWRKMWKVGVFFSAYFRKPWQYVKFQPRNLRTKTNLCYWPPNGSYPTRRI
jgi:hypothetical protein